MKNLKQWWLTSSVTSGKLLNLLEFSNKTDYNSYFLEGCCEDWRKLQDVTNIGKRFGTVLGTDMSLFKKMSHKAKGWGSQKVKHGMVLQIQQEIKWSFTLVKQFKVYKPLLI